MFRFVPQHDQMDCGPACLSMIAGYHGATMSMQFIKSATFLSKEGVSLLQISETAKKIGFETFSTMTDLQNLDMSKELFPCILHWNQNHFVVLQKISRSIISKKNYYHIADPAHGLIKLSEEKFKLSWLTNNNKGVVLFLDPTENIYQHQENGRADESLSIRFIFSYLKPFKKQLVLLFLFLLVGSGLTLVFPFLTQVLIDKGVNGKDLNFIFLVLAAQLGFFLGSIIIEVFRNWVMLYMGTKLSITIISDFLKRMLKLPIKFFDTKLMGDFNQRIRDNERIENFLTSQSLLTFFSVITFSVFFGVLWYYDVKILVIYLFLTILSIAWSTYWLKKRRILDYYRFQQRSENQESIYEIINGVTEMKLNQYEDLKRKEWEQIQLKLFKTNIRILKLDQVQLSGFNFVNQLKNILVTFLAARYVVEGTMTLGALLSISYIIGQMNAPLSQLISFFRSFQDARLSLERLNEIQTHPEEEQDGLKGLPLTDRVSAIADNKGITFENVSFQYEGPKSPKVLKDVNIVIPNGKITAIVGASGSGKTTLMKLLLKFYLPTDGCLKYDGTPIEEISPNQIRENSGVVMQDGYIFSDTIERKIATGQEEIDQQKLQHAVKVANIESFVESLPLGFKTKIGAAGNGISGGQKQRILIARAVYKNPIYLFFDEATSALDAENEKTIHDNLQSFFAGKTVVIIAHRLSTVKQADQIIVLKNGEVTETGNHLDLVGLKRNYYTLIKNQLELGG